MRYSQHSSTRREEVISDVPTEDPKRHTNPRSLTILRAFKVS